MLSGNLAALLQTSIKRMLAWSSIAQMGYVALALVAAPTGGLHAALFYMLAYAAAGMASFGAVAVLSGQSERDSIDAYRGLGYRSPLAGAALALAMFSLAGIPPTGGFLAKFGVFTAALRGGETTLALLGILTALISVFFYLRIVVTLYMKPQEVIGGPSPLLELSERVALIIPMAATLLLGVFPGPLLELLTHVIQSR
jgi:NADH-quinone oxidoreductase subunit N